MVHTAAVEVAVSRSVVIALDFTLSASQLTCLVGVSKDISQSCFHFILVSCVILSLFLRFSCLLSSLLLCFVP